MVDGEKAVELEAGRRCRTRLVTSWRLIPPALRASIVRPRASGDHPDSPSSARTLPVTSPIYHHSRH